MTERPIDEDQAPGVPALELDQIERFDHEVDRHDEPGEDGGP
ncbi:hypothetical protein [Georgenia sp. MJ170]